MARNNKSKGRKQSRSARAEESASGSASASASASASGSASAPATKTQTKSVAKQLLSPELVDGTYVLHTIDDVSDQAKIAEATKRTLASIRMLTSNLTVLQDRSQKNFNAASRASKSTKRTRDPDRVRKIGTFEKLHSVRPEVNKFLGTKKGTPHSVTQLKRGIFLHSYENESTKGPVKTGKNGETTVVYSREGPLDSIFSKKATDKNGEPIKHITDKNMYHWIKFNFQDEVDEGDQITIEDADRESAEYKEAKNVSRKVTSKPAKPAKPAKSGKSGKRSRK